MIQYLVITARNHPDLYGYLRRQFVGDDRVQVLFDRRHDERRRRSGAHQPDRRRSDRRGGRGKATELGYHGFVVIRQFSGVQWRPPWWGQGAAETASEIARQAGMGGEKGLEARDLVARWVAEGQHLLGVVPRLLREHEQLTARAEAAERKCERYDEELRCLRSENEHFRRERRQTAETLKALTRQLMESASGVSPVKG